MLEILKKKSSKSAFTRIIISIIIIVGCLLITKFSVIDFIKGGTKLAGDFDPAALEGEYVSFDAKYLVEEYVEHTSTNTDTNKTTTTGNSYIVYDYDDDVYFGIYLPYSDQSTAYKLIDESWAWMAGEIDDVSTSITVEGTWTPLTGELLTYYDETAALLFDTADLDFVLPYYIDSDSINGVSFSTFYILMVIFIIAVIYLIYTIARFLGGSYDKAIKKYLTANPSISLANIEADFMAATVVNGIRIGKNWTVYITGTRANIFSNRDIVWAYYYKRTGRNSLSQINAYTIQKDTITIPVSESCANQILDLYATEQPHMVTGFSADLEKTYKKDFPAFLNMKYNQAVAAEQYDAVAAFAPADNYNL